MAGLSCVGRRSLVPLPEGSRWLPVGEGGVGVAATELQLEVEPRVSFRWYQNFGGDNAPVDMGKTTYSQCQYEIDYNVYKDRGFDIQRTTVKTAEKTTEKTTQKTTEKITKRILKRPLR